MSLGQVEGGHLLRHLQQRVRDGQIISLCGGNDYTILSFDFENINRIYSMLKTWVGSGELLRNILTSSSLKLVIIAFFCSARSWVAHVLVCGAE